MFQFIITSQSVREKNLWQLGVVNTLYSINEVILHRARLVLGWVTSVGLRVNHLGI